MQTQAKLCHLDQARCVVLVEGFEGDRSLGSALGEGSTVMEAEDLAIARLQHRSAGTTVDAEKRPTSTGALPELGGETRGHPAVRQHAIVRQPPAPAGKGQENVSSTTPVLSAERQEAKAPEGQAIPTPHGNSAGATSPLPPSEAPTDPDDWSEELTAIDLELQRIGWDRDKERIYLERAFGHGSRHRLTRFNDLVAYLKRLRDLPPGSDPQQTSVPLRRSDLVQQSDEILQRLNWQQEQAREFLNQNFQATSRQQLTDEQLLTFNMLLEEQLVAKPR